MPEYLSPGVYVEEINSGIRPIEGVGTACAAFVGFAPAGPVGKPSLITNWSQFVDTYGALDEGGARNPHLTGAYLSHAVYGYFLNGGTRCYVSRIGVADAPDAKPAAVQLPSRSSKAIPSLFVRPKSAPNQDIQVEVAPPAGDQPVEGTFTLKFRMGKVEEVYENVSLGKRSARNVLETVNNASQLVVLVEAQTSGTLVERAPEIGTYMLKMAPAAAGLPQVQSKHFAGAAASRDGIEGLEVADDVTMVCCPDIMAAFQANLLDRDGVKAAQLAMVAHCERMADRVAILDPLPNLSALDIKRWRETDSGVDSKYAALYYPWLVISGPDGRPMSIPPSGHVAGIYARSDTERGVHKAPANEIVRGALEPVAQITKGEQSVLNPIGVNCIRSFTGRGLRVWGARTLSSDPAWRYINVRRLFNYVEKSIERDTQWVVFEPNDPDLWARVTRDVEAFLTGVWRSGALFGRTAEEAFFVKCDEELNSADVRNRGQLIIEVGIAPVKPAEFVVFRLSQYAGGGA